jgi:hypothetical protein
MSRAFAFSLATGLGFIASTVLAQSAKPTTLVSGLKNPESICYAANGKLYLTEIGEEGKDGDGRVLLIEDGKATPFATGLDDPKGICAFKDMLFVTDKTKVVSVSASGRVSVLFDAKAFPVPPLYLNDIAVEPRSATVLVSDSGDTKGKEGKVYRIDLQKKNASL